ncbi:MAG: T9SS type A sorting domain-containing protein [Candidatus Zixiibacteriota bacterium]|nr:MAG: T9SS type A sorting domain-containing protein [candidate division Zixibacteria bacterium]
MLKRHALVLTISILAPLASQQVLADDQMWGNDVLVHQADHIYGFGLDQADNDTLFLVVSDSSTANLKDTLYVYRSTDNGKSWNNVTRTFPATDNLRYGKADIIAAKGDSNFVFVFWIRDTGAYKGLSCIRFHHDFAGPILLNPISTSENVVDFDVCQDLYPNYWLYVVYQTDQDSVVFKRSQDYGKTWERRKNLTAETPITSQPSLAWSQGPYLLVAGKTDDDKIYAIRNDNSGRDDAWKAGQYPSGYTGCGNPVVAGSHTTPANQAVFWVFYEFLMTTPAPHYELRFQWSTDAGASWSVFSQPSDTSGGNRLYPSLRVLKENEAQNITLAYRYEGTVPRQIRYIYKSNGQVNPSVWTAPYSGINDYSPHYRPPQEGYTLRGTDNSIRSAVLYVRDMLHDLYFDASAFTDVENELENRTISGFSLEQNYPNPFNPSTSIEFVTPRRGWVTLEVYNILGQKVRQLLADHLQAGSHRIAWDGKDDTGKDLTNGIYFYRMRTEDFIKTKKMILLK